MQIQWVDGWDLFLYICFAVYIVLIYVYFIQLCAIGELSLFCNSIWNLLKQKQKPWYDC